MAPPPHSSSRRTGPRVFLKCNPGRTSYEARRRVVGAGQSLTWRGLNCENYYRGGCWGVAFKRTGNHRDVTRMTPRRSWLSFAIHQRMHAHALRGGEVLFDEALHL